MKDYTYTGLDGWTLKKFHTTEEQITLIFRYNAATPDKQIIIKPKLFSHGTQSVKPYTAELTCIMLEEKEVVKKEVVESKIL